ncbi:MAG: hypothetical protein RL291_1101 [Pseudomonadota bacterium]
MTGLPSSTAEQGARRYLALWLPFLPDDRWRHDARQRGAAIDESLPRVFTVKVRGATRIAAVDRRASALGLARKMTLADARARVPALDAIEHDPRANALYLEVLADAAGAFTPSVAFDLPHGLALDITGCAHLFSGEIGLARRLKTALETHGASSVRMAIATTPDMARALARFATKPFTRADDATAVRTLPVAAFECGHEDQRALERAGLRTIGDVASRPSVLFTSRFTKAFTAKLARLLGEEDRRITPFRPEPPLTLDHICAEPVASHAVIEEIITSLFTRATQDLEARAQGGRIFTTSYFRSDGALRRVAIRTSAPTRDVGLLKQLHNDRMDAIADPLDPGFGFDLIRLDVSGTETLASVQNTLDQKEETDGEITRLQDRLAILFGRERISTLEPLDTHLPERAQSLCHPGDPKSPTPWPSLPCPRPASLFPTPQLIDAATANDLEPPERFVWRRQMHKILFAEGPERIADEWWLTPSGFGTRDYYSLTTESGQRFWVFRAHATDNRAPATWFLHGVFP